MAESAPVSAPSPTPPPETILEVRDLRTHFHMSNGVARAVDGVGFSVGRKEVVSLVGESGCGKSVTALSIMRLIPTPPGRIESGQVLFRGEDLLKRSDGAMRRIRGARISMIFQEPMTSLNPVFTVGNQIDEAILTHESVGHAAARGRTIMLLNQVGIPDAEQRAREYPHQLSGGMRQRVMIAMALACRPDVLIADEPTTALDVTIQAQILALLNQLQHQFEMSILLITHDLGVVAETADRVAVMYAGQIAEYAPVDTLFAEPRHPYTQGLFRSIPSLAPRGQRLQAIAGTVPDPLHFPTGCRFHPRCPRRFEPCPVHNPPLDSVGPDHTCACWAAFRDLGRPVPE